MTATAVTNDQKQKPTAEQVDTYTRRESELRQRYLKGILHIDGVLALLQQALELVKNFINCDYEPEIPSWADQENPISQHLRCGMVDPERLTTISVFGEKENTLDGEDFIARAQKLDSMNACAFDFYAKPENWKYLPKDVDVIVFPKTVFCYSLGYRFVRSLCRDGAGWGRCYDWLDDGFLRRYRVAVLASSTQNSDPKLS
ncbi:MAG: hypothetical protein US12_C0013G0009 [Parcubacteria group bacterium GW2011_GWA2_36_24]|nr:MAG: hypothetical protein US12_C0013G0009 [Parcubacteria group bacterium GW2011_GWA2_36_24]